MWWSGIGLRAFTILAITGAKKPRLRPGSLARTQRWRQSRLRRSPPLSATLRRLAYGIRDGSVRARGLLGTVSLLEALRLTAIVGASYWPRALGL